MRIRWAIISFIILSILIACAPRLKSQKVLRDNREMLFGPVTQEQLYFDYPQWRQVEDDYQPDPVLAKKLSQLSGPYQVKIFFGTWCSDSRRELPAFFKIIKQAGIRERMDIQLWAVDRKLKLDNALAQNNGINKVATFIFYKNAKELGRIIESPETLLLEQDLFNILSKIPK